MLTIDAGRYLGVLVNAYNKQYRERSDEWTRDAQMRLFPALVQERLKLPRTTRVLDVGCGAGDDAGYLSRHFAFVTGIDIYRHEAWDDVLRERSNVEFRCLDLLSMPDGEQYDLVLDNGCFHHQHPDQHVTYLRKAAALLDDGGHFVLSTFKNPAVDEFVDRNGRLHKYFGDAELHAALAAAGFAVTGQLDVYRPKKEDHYRVSFCRKAVAHGAADMQFVAIPEGVGRIGSTPREAEACVAQWADRLAQPEFTRERFASWIAKEVPLHFVRFAPFRIGRFPVTNAQYREFVEMAGAEIPESLVRGEAPDCPVWGVSYEECERFAAWHGGRTGTSCRLPTEAEWEYAARGRDGNEYPYGDEFDAAKGNTLESEIGHVTPVDAYAAHPSGFGVCDMAGNVEEWTSSRYAPYPNGSPVRDDLVNACGAEYRVLRGGSFCRTGDLARCARRHGPYPGAVYRFRGFRVVVDSR